MIRLFPRSLTDAAADVLHAAGAAASERWATWCEAWGAATDAAMDVFAGDDDA